MDTLSHGLWATAAAQATNRITRSRLKIGWMALWGVFPDLASFTPAILWIIMLMVVRGVPFAHIPRPELMPPAVRESFFIFRLTGSLYRVTHSMVIFSAVFFLVWGVRWLRSRYRQLTSTTASPLLNNKPAPCWEMIGWLLHVVMDIPAHSKALFPTPFLWPLSSFTFDGVSWAKPWFLAVNYGMLLVVFLALPFLRSRGEDNKRVNR